MNDDPRVLAELIRIRRAVKTMLGLQVVVVAVGLLTWMSAQLG